MKRVVIWFFALCSACCAKEWEPNEVEISLHRQEVYQLARDFVVETFNLEVKDESQFNPVRFNSNGVWGTFETRIKELGDDRFEVQGWVSVRGHAKPRTPWTVHVRYRLLDPQAWRYRKIDEVAKNKPEILGWKFGAYHSLGYKADYDPAFLAMMLGGGMVAKKDR